MDASHLRLHQARLDVRHHSQQKEASDTKAKLVGIDLAKSVFQVCVIALSGSVLFNKKFMRAKFLEWLKDLESTTAALEAAPQATHDSEIQAAPRSSAFAASPAGDAAHLG